VEVQNPGEQFRILPDVCGKHQVRGRHTPGDALSDADRFTLLIVE
jgi:hypothetical protein